ncbi:SHOCT domain-containing protein [Streptomyces sp. NPDC089424]|uniref:SHOCT domain-containing protein n=1 Tax=Streptomyces sp. NPDC089424 TaxID=3365917 RepID=UPI0037F36F32
MPGLLRGGARTAVVAGSATAVSHRVSRRQAGRWTEQDAHPQPAAPAAPASLASDPGADMTGRIEQLKQLADLKAQGVLTEEEFEAQRRRVLA